MGLINPDKGTESKTFDVDGGEAQVKIRWESNSLNYELVYNVVPHQLFKYFDDPLQEPSQGAVTISFTDNDGFQVTERPCHVVDFVYNKNDKTLRCSNSAQALSMPSDIDQYRRISGVSVTIN